MKKLLTKSFLLMAGLLVGSSVWAQTKTSTVDFITYTNTLGKGGTKTLTLSEETLTNALGNTLYVPEDLSGLVMYNYIAVSNDVILRCGKVGATEYGNNGLWHGKSGNNRSTVYASIINLHPGDKVTIYGSNVFFVSTNVTDDVAAGDAVTMQTEYTIESGTQLDLKINNGTNTSWCYIAKVVIESEYDGVSKPSMAETGVSGTAKLVTITAGVSSHGNDVTTYYTTDGTTPSASNNAGSFTGSSHEVTITSTSTVKAVSISSKDVSSYVASADVEAGAKTPMHTPTATLVGMAGTAGAYYPVYTFSSDNSDLSGTPVATSYTYTFTPTSGESSSGTLTDAKYTFTTPGTLEVTACITDESYTDSEAKSVTVSSKYVRTQYVDVANFYPGVSGEFPTELEYDLIDKVSFSPVNLTSGLTYRTKHNSDTYNAYFARNKAVTVTCSGIEEGMIAVFGDYTGANIATLTSNGTFTLGKNSGTLKYYSLYVLPSTTSSVTVTSAGWKTLCSPYSLDFTDVDGVTAYIVTGTESDNSTLTLTKVNKVPAQTGVLLEGAGTFDVPVIDISLADKVSANKLVGVVTNKEKAASSIYVLMNESAGVGFYKNNNAFTVGANTAYLNVADFAVADGEAPVRLSFGEVEATAISGINVAKPENEVLYNVAGQRVSDSYKGIVIKNGKKYLSK